MCSFYTGWKCVAARCHRAASGAPSKERGGHSHYGKLSLKYSQLKLFVMKYYNQYNLMNISDDKPFYMCSYENINYLSRL